MEDIKRLIIKSIKGTLSEEEGIFLLHWVNESEERKNIYASVRDVWALNEMMKQENHDNRQAYKKVMGKINPYQHLRLKIAITAAVIFIAIMIPNFIATNFRSFGFFEEKQIVLISNNSSYTVNDKLSVEKIETILSEKSVQTTFKENQVNRIIVPSGKTCEIALSDGTSVILNAMSELTFPSYFSDSLREVTLEGEAVFNVKRDEQAPFIVKTNNTITRVLGTHFNISAYRQDKEEVISLLSGSVKTTVNGLEQMLKPGEQVRLNYEKGSINIVHFNPEEVFAWQSDLFLFEDRSLLFITKHIERWYDVEFEFTCNSLKNINAYVKIKKNKSLNELLDALSSTNKVHFEKHEDKIFVLPKL